MKNAILGRLERGVVRLADLEQRAQPGERGVVRLADLDHAGTTLLNKFETRARLAEILAHDDADNMCRKYKREMQQAILIETPYGPVLEQRDVQNSVVEFISPLAMLYHCHVFSAAFVNGYRATFYVQIMDRKWHQMKICKFIVIISNRN